MPRNTELISRQYAGRHPLPAVPLADNALHLKGIPGELYVLREELEQETGVLSQGLLELSQALEGHAENTDIHLSPEQVTKIQNAIDAVQALNIANQAINEIVPEIEGDARSYTDLKFASARSYTDGKFADAKDYTDEEVSVLEGTVTELQETVTELGSTVEEQGTAIEELQEFVENMDEYPIEGSTNAVTSGGLYEVIGDVEQLLSEI